MYNTTRNAQVTGVRFRQQKSSGAPLSPFGEPEFDVPDDTDVSGYNLWCFVDFSIGHRVEVLLSESEVTGKISFSSRYFQSVLEANGHRMLKEGDHIRFTKRGESDESSWYVLGDKVDNDGVYGGQLTIEYTLLRTDKPERL